MKHTPSYSNCCPRSPDSGLTLLEVLVVLAIIALVTTLATPRLMET